MQPAYLTEKTTEGKLYLLFMQERTQKEVAEYLYDKPYSDVNIKSVKRAREQMIEDGILTTDGSLRNAQFRSNLDPFIEYLFEEIEKTAAGEEERARKLTEGQKSALRKLIDSNWFRSFFDLSVLDKTYYLKRNDKGHLEFSINHKSCAITAVGQVLRDIAAFDSHRWSALNDRTDHLVSIDKVNEYPDFGSYVEEHGTWFLDDYELKDGAEPITPEVGFNMVWEDMGSNHDKESWDYYVAHRLFVEEELVLRLPHIGHFCAIGRRQSNLWGMWGDLSTEIGNRYKAWDISYFPELEE